MISALNTVRGNKLFFTVKFLAKKSGVKAQTHAAIKAAIIRTLAALKQNKAALAGIHLERDGNKLEKYWLKNI